MKFLIGDNPRSDSTDMSEIVRVDPLGGTFDPSGMPDRVIMFDTKEFTQFLSHLAVSRDGCFGDEMLIKQVMGEFHELGQVLERNG